MRVSVARRNHSLTVPGDIRGPGTVILLAVALAGGAFAIQGHFGLNLSDEGHLWYIATRTALGDVPLRDVNSYDPARYYWGAAGFKLFGPGLVSLRLGLSVVRAAGLIFGLLVLGRVVRRWWVLAVLGSLLVAWMHPLYKAWECVPVLAFAWLFVRLLEAPTRSRYFSAGLGVGLAAFVRIDHGVYGAVALAFLTMFLVVCSRPVRARDLAVGALGIVVGYAPMLWMLAVVPGFLHGFGEYIAYRLRIVAWDGNTSLSAPVPWPWRALPPMPLLSRLYALSLGILFASLPAAYLYGLLSMVRARTADTPSRRVVVAAGLAGMMYVHYAFSRPDILHLAPSVQSLIALVAGLVAGIGSRSRAVVAVVGTTIMVGLTVLTVGLSTPLYLRSIPDPDPFIQARVADDVLWVRASTAAFLARTQAATEQLLQPGERLLVLPYWPGLYAILGRESPVWETYFIVPEPEERQYRMIADMQRRKVTLVVFADLLIDGRADLHFSRTHPLVYRHLLEDFVEIRVPGMVSWVHVLRRMSSTVPESPRP